MWSLKKLFRCFSTSLDEKTWENTPTNEYAGILKELETKIIKDMQDELNRRGNQQCESARERRTPRVLYLNCDEHENM